MTSAHIIKQNQQSDSSTWDLPSVTDENVAQDESTNALGIKKNWRYEPPQPEEEEEVVPLTAEDIEAIRQAAFEEGFNQGKEEGFEKGFEEGKAAGHAEGKQAGHQEGLAQGLNDGQAQVDEQSQALAKLVQHLHQPLLNVEKNVEQQLLTLVAQLVEAVTLHEAKTSPDILLSAIEQGMKALPSQETETQILMNPADIKRMEQVFGEEYIQEQGWRLLAAPQFEQGGCQIENSISNIDLQLKSRLKEVLDSFLQDAFHQ